MVVTIHFQKAEDFKWIEPLMQLLKQSNVKVDFKGSASTKRASTKSTPKKQAATPITEQLQGVIKLPEGFDYKTFMSDELQKKYLANG
ncbi:MAG: hypothetical protein EPO28_14535 [Saprospiraceae bacterium]|nr:MAG: hypothetical protein EPO28_14535 [Saprospiraceae bacterium]